MRLLLDTQILVWAVNDDRRLPRPIRSLIADPANELHISAPSLWEATIKISLGKLSVPGNSIDFARQTGTDLLPIRPEHLRVLQTHPCSIAIPSIAS